MSIGPIRAFTVAPSIPPSLAVLRALAMNLRWSWHGDTAALFQRLDAELWESTHHNPVRLLALVDQRALDRAAGDQGFLDHLERVKDSLARYMARPPFPLPQEARAMRVAYFSAEVALAECIPTYAGGLGVLAGDHLKSASDLGVPMAGITLFYHEGYTQQRLAGDGWQQDHYPALDPGDLPMELCRHAEGAPLQVSVELPDGPCQVQVWRVTVGRVPLYMLDTNLHANSEAHRHVTARLYGGDGAMRLRQELVLGIGGVRALRALGEEPTCFHMNEGHAAFLAIERIRLAMAEQGLAFDEARELAASTAAFTTHTPVRAGHDEFDAELIKACFPTLESRMGLSPEEFLALGREPGAGPASPFNMTVLALRLSRSRNAVSRLHGRVSRTRWNHLWPGLPHWEVPIGSVTNGVHIPTWVHKEVGQLYDLYLGLKWRDDPEDTSAWENVHRAPEAEIWRCRQRRREELVFDIRRRLQEAVLDPEVLTIGFARRFAPYKRADLLLRDPDRLDRLVNHPERPMQLVFAGKAHPNNDEGKEMLRRVYQAGRQERFRGRIVFLEGYDMELARKLVQGVDLWLNTPRRPLEASGTSGMKAALNGVLQLSSDDGWWAEADREGHGWTIGGTEELDPESVDAAETAILYDVLEKEVAPAFYDRGTDGLPARWLAMVKGALVAFCPVFNTHRMVREYCERYYLPGCLRARDLSEEGMRRLKELAAWQRSLPARFAEVRAEVLEAEEGRRELTVGSSLKVRVRVHFGRMRPEEVVVQLFAGRLGPDGNLTEGTIYPLDSVRREGSDGTSVYEGRIPLSTSGTHGFAVRILPHHRDLADPLAAGRVLWA